MCTFNPYEFLDVTAEARKSDMKPVSYTHLLWNSVL